MNNHERSPRPSYCVLHDFESTQGTERQGYVTAPYEHLVSLFGEPLQGDGRKIDVQWIVGTDQGIGTIYNFNLSERTTPIEAITDWHVGGKDEEAYRAIIEIVQGEHGKDGNA